MYRGKDCRPGNFSSRRRKEIDKVQKGREDIYGVAGVSFNEGDLDGYRDT